MIDLKFIKKNYKKRLTDSVVERGLKLSGAVLINGSKWCGKTWTSCYYSNSLVELANPEGNFANKRLALISPDKILEGDTPRTIDEWQEAPKLWDAIRHSVTTKNKGSYILTGSITPNIKNNSEISHSGFGRILQIQMYPMSLVESDDFIPFITIGDLFMNKKITNNKKGSLTIDQILNLTIRGGWPELINNTWEDAKFILKGNIKNISNEKSIVFGKIRINNDVIIAIFKSYTRNLSTYADIETLYKDTISHLSKNISLNTFKSYLTVLKEMYILDEIKSWKPNLRSKVRMRGKSKIVFVDPSLACCVIDATPKKFLNDLNYFGFFFENLVLRDLRTFCSVNGYNLFQYRDSSGLEIDAIIEKDDGEWGAIEIKLGQVDVEKAVNNFKLFDKKIGKTCKIPPSFYCVITGVGGVLEKIDNIYFIPFDLLGC